MADQGVKLFLSCASDEFGAYRDELRRKLTRPNVEVKMGRSAATRSACWRNTSSIATRSCISPET
jgi:hypothetical protein